MFNLVLFFLINEHHDMFIIVTFGDDDGTVGQEEIQFPINTVELRSILTPNLCNVFGVS